MTPQIRLQKQHLADLQCIRDIGSDSLGHVVTELKGNPASPIKPGELRELMAVALGGNSTFAGVLLKQLLSLHGMRRQLQLSSTDIFAGLSAGLKESGWDEPALEKWKSASEAFKELFDLPIVHLTAKALDLSYQHAHLLQSAHIITDIRPLFNSDATEIQGTTISHKLLLRYDDIEGEHGLSVAVDERDLELLIKQCERALKKSKTVRTQLKEKAGLETLIPGAD